MLFFFNPFFLKKLKKKKKKKKYIKNFNGGKIRPNPDNFFIFFFYFYFFFIFFLFFSIMGGSPSKDLVSLSSDRLIIKACRAENVPKADIGSESDPFVRLWVTDSKNSIFNKFKAR